MQAQFSKLGNLLALMRRNQARIVKGIKNTNGIK
jgi:hypothetical protein